MVLEAATELLGSLRDCLPEYTFVPGESSLSSPLSPLVTVVLYVTFIWTAKRYFALELNLFPVLLLHNIFLALFSFVLFLQLNILIWPKLSLLGWHGLMCNSDMFDDPKLQWVYYVNYMLKYYELLDTVFMVLRKRPTTFLHVYHHAATMSLGWVQLTSKTACQWFVVYFNLLVHSVMYLYYLLSALNFRVWWKKYVTVLQLIQFLIDLAGCTYVVVVFARHGPSYCQGTWFGNLAGYFLILSYLVLFYQFYLQTYSSKQRSFTTKSKLS